jgi:hypothetical protein
MNYQRKPFEAGFWARVNKTEACWIWMGSKNSKGYGVRRKPGGGVITMHRYSFELANGPIGMGLNILHSCDNPSCVNPAHLRAGSQADNVADMVSRGRAKSGNTKKTHCPQGHEYSPKNTYTCKANGRHCREYDRTRQNIRHHKKTQSITQPLAQAA